MTEHADHDDLVALALAWVEPDERARLSGHLAGCGSCRADYEEIADAVQLTLAAAPSIAPPAGFSGGVLSAMGMAEPSRVPVGSDVVGVSPALGRRRSWTPLLAAAAALVLGLAAGVAGTLALVGRTPPVGPTTTASPAATASASPTSGGVTSASALVSRTGETVGTAGVATMAGREYLVITVTRAKPGMAYECVIVAPDGRRHSAGTWALDAHYGGTEASGTWLVELPAGGLEHVELVAPSGVVWSRATF